MSTNPQPAEYFGPHAKRWTSPSGEVLSLRPSDYEDMVNRQMELDYLDRELAAAEQVLAARSDEAKLLQQVYDAELRELARLKTLPTLHPRALEAIEQRERALQDGTLDVRTLLRQAQEAGERAATHLRGTEAEYLGNETPHPDGPNPITGAELWLGRGWSMEDYLEAQGVITIDELDAEALANSPEAGLFKHPGIPYIPEETMSHFDAIVKGATRGGITYPGNVVSPPADTRPPNPPGITMPAAPKLAVHRFGEGPTRTQSESTETIIHWWNGPEGAARFPGAGQDGTLGRRGRPAARHLKRRKLWRAAAALGLVYIIFVIGATLVTGAL